MIRTLLYRVTTAFTVFCLILCCSACGEEKIKKPATSSSVSSGSDSSSVSENSSSDDVSDNSSSAPAFREEVVTSEETITKQTKVPLNTYKNNFGVYEVLKTYINPNNSYTVEQMLPSVGYMVKNKITDTMFDSFIVLPSPVNVHDHAITKSFVQQYIDVIYKDGKNLDALNEAAAKVGATLGKSNYKVNVFLPLFRPLITSPDFGEVNGKSIDCSTDNGRIEALKWMADEHKKVFDSHRYSNLKFVGYYWYDEFANVKEDGAVIKGINEYIHSKGAISIWSPYYNASGYSEWKNLGFDLASMQSNYFPGVPESPNAGSVDRLAANAILTESCGMGVELELAGSSVRAGIMGFKESMQMGISTKTMDGYHVYYIVSGPSDIYSIYTNKKEYFQSAYHELHRYIKGILKDDDIQF